MTSTIFFLAELGFNCFLPTFLYLPARAVIYRLAGQIHCLPGQGFIQAAKSAAKAPICNRDYNSKGCQNYPRFLVKLSPVFVAPVHCLLWTLVMTNWLDTINLCYPALLSHNKSQYIHTRFFSFRSTISRVPSSLQKTQTDPHRLLAESTFETWTCFREESICGGTGAERARKVLESLWNTGKYSYLQ